MRKSVRLAAILGLVFVAGLSVCFFVLANTPKVVRASTTLTENYVPDKYSGYTNYGGSVLKNYTKATFDSGRDPSVTVLVHGQGGSASHWCNINGGSTLYYHGSSMIERIRMAAGQGAVVYLAKVHKKYVECFTPDSSHVWSSDCEAECGFHQCTENCERVFTLTKLTKGSAVSSAYYKYNAETVSKITDFNKHAIIVFESTQGDNYREYHSGTEHNHYFHGGNTASHAVAYSELDYVIDRIVADYRYITGFIPKINLVSHSRGGILSMMYATEHPYNVSNMISVGTPYRGSLFARSDLIVDGLGLRGTIDCPSGQDIVSITKQIALRNSWNDMLAANPNANINAVAIGAETEMSFITGLIHGGYLDGYRQEIGDFFNVLESGLIEFTGAAIALLHETYPTITELIFLCVNIGIDAFQFYLSFDLYTYAQIEALQRIINNSKIAYGNLVIMDDLFIDLDSQTAQGFNGFTRYSKTFRANNTNYNAKSVNDVPIPHNLEARDVDIINFVLSELTFGAGFENYYQANTYLNEVGGDVSTNKFSVVEFNVILGGDYTVAASSGVRFVVLDSIGGNVIATSESGLPSFEGEANQTFFIYMSVSGGAQTVYAWLSVNLPTLVDTPELIVPAGKTMTFVKSYNYNTVKKIYVHPALTSRIYSGGEIVSYPCDGGFAQIFYSGQRYYLNIHNPYSSSIYSQRYIYDVPTVSENVTESVRIYRSDNVYSFTSGSAKTYVFSLKCTFPNIIPSVRIYNSNLTVKTSIEVIGENKVKMYKFDAAAGETVYFGFKDDANGSGYATINVREHVSDFYWMVDGAILENSVLEMKRNEQYSGVLSFYYNDELLSGTFLPVTYSNNYLVVDSVGGRVKVLYSTPLTYGDVHYQYLAWFIDSGEAYLTEALRIRVLPAEKPRVFDTNDSYDYKFNVDSVDRRDFGNLSETVRISFKIQNYMGGSMLQNEYISQGTSIYNILISRIIYYYGSGILYVSVESMTYYFDTYSVSYNINDNPDLFDGAQVSLIGYFNSGDGTSSAPYLISNERHLRNIKYASEYYGGIAKIYSHFRLINNIFLTSNWQAVPDSFGGVFDGNDKGIFNMQIHAHQDGEYYGLFKLLDYGTVKNLNLYNVNIYGSTNNNSEHILVGSVAGYSFHGNIRNCCVYEGTISINTYKSLVGGIVGFNFEGRVYNCGNYQTAVSGCGTIGGVVGLSGSGSTITYCWNSGVISYYYNTDNGCAGGIVGMNNGSSIEYCSNMGRVQYTGAPSNDTNIAPCMAQIVGWLAGGSQSNNDCNGTTDFSNLKTSVGGFLGIGAKNQRRYCSNGAVGKTGD